MLPKTIESYLTNNTGLQIDSAIPVSGGDINHAFKIKSENQSYFLKYNTSIPNDFFLKEAAGLDELRNAITGLYVPKVFDVKSPDSEIPGFLLMEYIESGSSGDSFQFGCELAKLHQQHQERFGLDSDNYIGSLPQMNSTKSSWIEFFIHCRIEPQLKMAIDSAKFNSSIIKSWNHLASRLDTIFPPAKPSLLHGDLWGGNYLFNEKGRAVLIDPAVYYGHPEMDLAFTRMFGGFSNDFYDGYKSVSPIEHGFSDRIPIYNLYPLLVHVNLFGGHYISQAKQILERI